MDHHSKKLTIHEEQIQNLHRELIYLTRDWNPIDLFRSREDRKWAAYDRLSETDQLLHRITEAKIYNRLKS